MAGRRVLALDAPNIDMTLAQLLGRRPGPPDRPDLRALLRWVAARREAGEEIEAAVFVNVPLERPQGLQSWIAFLTSIGFRVFAKPRAFEGSDVDEDMVAYVQSAATEAAEIIVASNDARRFRDPLAALSAQGTRVTVIGFAELAGDLADTEGVEFVDLEDIPGLLTVSLQRIRLDTLPDEGGWFEPRVSPEDLLGTDTGMGLGPNEQAPQIPADEPEPTS